MPIVLSTSMLSQVAALMYISWTYFLELGLKPSENWHQEKLSKYEFIGIRRRRSKDLRYESEKVK